MTALPKAEPPRAGPPVARAAVDFESHRRWLTGLAYRMLGSLASAEDMVQEAYLRLQGSGEAEIRSPRSYLATLVTRLCLDELKAAHHQRETYVGPWLPEPLVTEPGGPAPPLEPVDPDTLSMAFLVLLESLSPLERAVYLLAEVFDCSHAEVAEILDRDPAACRQLLHRARAHVQARRPRFQARAEEHERLLSAFLMACSAGDLPGLQALLADDVVSLTDGGGRAAAALRPVHGPDRVGRFLLGVLRKGGALGAELVTVNGVPGIRVSYPDGSPHSLTTLAVSAEGRITGLYSMRNPDKLQRVWPKD